MPLMLTPQATSIVVISPEVAAFVTPERIKQAEKKDAESRAMGMTAMSVLRQGNRTEFRRDIPPLFADSTLLAGARFLLGTRNIPVSSLGINFHITVTDVAPAKLDALLVSLVSPEATTKLLGVRTAEPRFINLRMPVFSGSLNFELRRVDARTGNGEFPILVITSNYDQPVTDTRGVRRLLSEVEFGRFAAHYERLVRRIMRVLQ